MDSSGELKKLVNLSKWQIFFQVFLVAALVVWPAATLISFSLPAVGLSDIVFLIGITLGATMIFVFAGMRWGIKEVPTVHEGAGMLFKRRTGRVYKEGWYFVFPGIYTIELVSKELQTTDIEISFYSKDQLEVIVEGTVQWCADLDVRDRDGRPKFLEMTEETITEGLKDAIDSELGIIGGVQDASAFREQREGIAFLINCVLRLSKSPHVKRALPPEARLAYYSENAVGIRRKLAVEANNIGDRSDVECTYAIDIDKFNLSVVDFSKETKKSLELKKQMEEKLKADQLQHEHLIKMVERLKELGVDPAEAINAAQVTLDQAEKKVFSLEGLGQLFGPKTPKITIERS